MYYVYVLLSKKDKGFYVGLSADVARRIKEHNAGHVKSTKGRRPLDLIYKEKQPTLNSAREKEKYFKSGIGREFLKKIPGSSIGRADGCR